MANPERIHFIILILNATLFIYTQLLVSVMPSSFKLYLYMHMHKSISMKWNVKDLVINIPV